MESNPFDEGPSRVQLCGMVRGVEPYAELAAEWGKVCAVGEQLTIPDGWITFPDANDKPAVRINVSTDPPQIEVDPDLAWDAAAKQFWNACYRIQGKPAPFGDV